jgi:DNA-directed RNA polymerase subunit N (RpoN/RPB10)
VELEVGEEVRKVVDDLGIGGYICDVKRVSVGP